MNFQADEHAAFIDAVEHNEADANIALSSLTKASHHLNGNNALARTIAIKHRANATSTGANPLFSKMLLGKHYDDVLKTYKSWCHYANFYGGNFASVQSLSSITAFLNGSAFLIRRTDTSKPIALTVQVVSSKMLATELNKEGTSRYVSAGIMYNKLGQVLKYAFYKLSPSHPAHNSENVVWIDAQDVEHLRDMQHAGQGLVEPTLTAAFLMINQWQDSQTIETKARLSKIATSVHYRTDPKGSNGRVQPQKKVIKAGSHNEVEADEIVFSPNRELAGNYQEHNLQALRQGAMVGTVTYEQASGDYSKTSFSSARMSRADQRTVTGQQRATVYENALNTVFKWFLNAWQVKRSIMLEGYDEDHYQYYPEWLWPQAEEIDPLKAAKANEVKLKTGEITQREMAISNGKNPDEHLKELKEQPYVNEQKKVRRTKSSP